MKKLLYVDSCVNRETSRTEQLAQALLERLVDEESYEVETLVLEEAGLKPLTGDLVRERIAGTAAGDFSHPVFGPAKQFADADAVLIAAPYWDFSFPSMLKVYLEYLCSQGVTFSYSPEGVPTGLVHAEKVYYVTTAGGYIGDYDYGLGQVKAICQIFFGVKDIRCFRAEGLDIVTNDVEAIMADALAVIRRSEL